MASAHDVICEHMVRPSQLKGEVDGAETAGLSVADTYEVTGLPKRA